MTWATKETNSEPNPDLTFATLVLDFETRSELDIKIGGRNSGRRLTKMELNDLIFLGACTLLARRDVRDDMGEHSTIQPYVTPAEIDKAISRAAEIWGRVSQRGF